jgi:hypothetical protein
MVKHPAASAGRGQCELETYKYRAWEDKEAAQTIDQDPSDLHRHNQRKPTPLTLTFCVHHMDSFLALELFQPELQLLEAGFEDVDFGSFVGDGMWSQSDEGVLVNSEAYGTRQPGMAACVII